MTGPTALLCPPSFTDHRNRRPAGPEKLRWMTVEVKRSPSTHDGPEEPKQRDPAMLSEHMGSQRKTKLLCQATWRATLRLVVVSLNACDSRHDIPQYLLVSKGASSGKRMQSVVSRVPRAAGARYLRSDNTGSTIPRDR